MHIATNIKELVKQLTEGKKSALDELYQYYYPKLYTFAKGFLKVESDVDDIVQEVFIKLWENRETIKNVETFNAWLFTITKNSVINVFREKIKLAEFESKVREKAISEDYTIDTTLEYDEIKMRVDQLIEQLPEKRKQIFKLSREQGLSNKEIAAQLNISLKTVEDHMMHAIRFLREKLKTMELFIILYIAIFI